MQPVWVLSVDLQTKTATFQSGLSDAAKSARGAFTDIKSGSNEMGRSVSGNMTEARHGVMLLGEEFGIHLPRALSTFIASIGPIGMAMEAAFPFLAIAALATILIEKIMAMHAAGQKLTEDQEKFGTAVNNAWSQLDQKLIQAQIRADELRNDHLGALKGQLELIDHQSMAELVHSFDEVAKAGDVVMKELEGHWYTFGRGSEGAKSALDTFQAKYESLMSAGKSDEASGLLHGTVSQASKALAMMQQLQTSGRSNSFGSFADPAKFHEAEDALNKMGIAHGETVAKQIEAQQNLVAVLNAQIGSEERIAAIKKQESDNAKTETSKEGAGRTAEAARQSAENALRLGELKIAAERTTAQTLQGISRASIAERLSSELDFAAREYQLKTTANQSEIAALDKGGKDYANQLKELQAKAVELTVAHTAEVAELTAKAGAETSAQSLRDMEQGERDKIEATQKGSAARLAAIDAAIKAEEAKNLQDTGHFRELLTQRTEVIQQGAEEAAKLNEEAGKEAADDAQKTGALTLAAEKQANALRDSDKRQSIDREIAEARQLANEELTLKQTAFAQEAAALDKNAKDYANKLKAIQDKERQTEQAHQNEITAIEERAEIERNQRILAARQRFNDTLSAGLTQVLMGHETFTKMMNQLGDQVVSGMIQNAIKSMLAADMTKEKDAASAARKAFNIGMSIGGPAGIVLGPVMGAAAFASVMAFEGGTDRVPGMGTGDIVPAMLTPGEGVVPGGVMDGLSKMARDGSMGGSHQTVVHVRPTYHVNTIDGDGMQAALTKHNEQLTKHFQSAVRKLNR